MTQDTPISVQVQHDVLPTMVSRQLGAFLDLSHPSSWLNVLCWCAVASWCVKYCWNWYKGDKKYESYSDTEKWMKGLTDVLTMGAVAIVALNGGYKQAFAVFRSCKEWASMLWCSTSAITTLRNLFFSQDTTDLVQADWEWFHECITSATRWMTGVEAKVVETEQALKLKEALFQAINEDGGSEEDTDEEESKVSYDRVEQNSDRMSDLVFSQRFPLAYRQLEIEFGFNWNKSINLPREQQIALGQALSEKVRAEIKQFNEENETSVEKLQIRLNDFLGRQTHDPITGKVQGLQIVSGFFKTQWRIGLILLVVLAGLIGGTWLVVQRRGKIIRKKGECVESLGPSTPVLVRTVSEYPEQNEMKEEMPLRELVVEHIEPVVPEVDPIVQRTVNDIVAAVDIVPQQECIHVSTCPKFDEIPGTGPVKADPWTCCNVKCTGHQCHHWSDCKPPEESRKGFEGYEGRVTQKMRLRKIVKNRGFVFYDELKKADKFADLKEYWKYLRSVQENNQAHGVWNIPADVDDVIWMDRDYQDQYYDSEEFQEDRELDERLDEMERKHDTFGGGYDDLTDDRPDGKAPRINRLKSDNDEEVEYGPQNYHQAKDAFIAQSGPWVEMEERYDQLHPPQESVPKYEGCGAAISEKTGVGSHLVTCRKHTEHPVREDCVGYWGREYEPCDEHKTLLGNCWRKHEAGSFKTVSRWKCRAPVMCGKNGGCANREEHNQPKSEFVQQAGVVLSNNVVRLAVPMDPKSVECKWGVRCKIGKCDKAHPPAVQGITERCHKIITNKGLRAIGDLLGTSEETVKNSLFRATRKLRASLGDLR
jgi:hypothetical protein